MSDGTLFYIFGSLLAGSAVVISFIGLKLRSFPGKAAPVVALWFIALIGCTTTFGVLHAQDEEEARASELVPAGEEVEKAEADSLEVEEGGEGEEGEAEKQEPTEGQKPAAGQAEGGEKAKPEAGGEAKPAGGAASTLKLAADPSEIAFDTTSLSTKAGNVTIDFTNPAPIEHDVAIEEGGKILAKSETITGGKTSVSVDLKPGSYTFLCTVPGHAEAGMEGTLTVR
jgi:plastocyanin